MVNFQVWPDVGRTVDTALLIFGYELRIEEGRIVALAGKLWRSTLAHA